MTTEDRTNDAAAPADHLPQYEIRVKGHLGTRWATWLGGFALTLEEDGTTVIRGEVVDQAALHGVLQKLRDVGIALVSLTEVPAAAPIEPPALDNHERN